MAKSPTTMLPAVKLCEQLGINRRTLDRWLKDESLDFPDPMIVNGRLFFDESKTEAWKRQRAAVSHKKRQHVAASAPEQTAA